MKNETTDLISVIIPAYNHQNYIGECIDSIAKQTYPNIEILILDDGSPDQTYEKAQQALAQYPNRFKRVWIEKQENAGKTESLNRLIGEAKGKYIYIIDSDDAAKPKAIEENWKFLKDNPDYVLSVGDNEFIDANSVRIFCSKYNKISYKESKEFFGTFADQFGIRLLGKDAFGKYETLFTKGNHVPNGYLIRTDDLKKMPKFTKNAPMEDFYMMLQLAKCGKFKYIDEVLYLRRFHLTNVSKSASHMLEMTMKTFEYEVNLIRSGNFSENCSPDFLMYAAHLYQKFS